MRFRDSILRAEQSRAEQSRPKSCYFWLPQNEIKTVNPAFTAGLAVF